MKSHLLRPKQVKQFQKIIYDYFERKGRKLPWRRTSDPYKILVSEIMLQQTQVPRVVVKYKEFIAAFPTIRHLAKAPLRRVMAVWQGMGYNRRVLLLKKLASQVVRRHNAKIPDSIEALQSLPGIGHASASSICAFAFNQPTVFIETNIRSVFIHHFFKDANHISDTKLLPLIELTLDRRNPCRWYSALMDYGTYLKSTVANPSRRSLHHQKQSRFEGSDRQLRGKILKTLLDKRKIKYTSLIAENTVHKKRIEKIILQLCKEGLIRRHKAYLFV